MPGKLQHSEKQVLRAAFFCVKKVKKQNGSNWNKETGRKYFAGREEKKNQVKFV